MSRYWVDSDDISYEKNNSKEPLMLFRWDEGYLGMYYESTTLAIF